MAKGYQAAKAADSSIKPVLLLGAAFTAGFFIMVLEMLGFRLLAPYFGYSTYVWGSLIGIIMTALSAGYLLGGFLADRYGGALLVFLAVFLSGVYAAVISFFYQSILLFVQGLGLVGGSIASAVLLFALPMLMLSTVSPFIIKIMVRENRVGTAAGTIYSISTIGSIGGTFLASFYLIPVLGSHKTLVICAGLLMLTGTAGLILFRKSSTLLLVFMLLRELSRTWAGG